MKKVSFVIPCYCSEHTILGVVAEICGKMDQLTEYSYNICLVNDCSSDNTMGVIRELCETTTISRGSALPAISGSMRR